MSDDLQPSSEFLVFQKALAGRYSLEEEAGRGGMGIVFLAREVALDRELAVPLRVFVNQTRGFESTVAWCLLGEMFLLPSFLAAVASDPPGLVLIFGLIVALLAGFPLATLVRYARQLLRSGYTLDDGVQALLQDVDRRNEEFRFQVGQRVTWVDRVIRGVKWGGFLGAGLVFVSGWLLDLIFPPLAVALFGWSLVTGLSGALLQEIRSRARGDVMGNAGSACGRAGWEGAYSSSVGSSWIEWLPPFPEFTARRR